jgi:hypothetical protein
VARKTNLRWFVTIERNKNTLLMSTLS